MTVSYKKLWKLLIDRDMRKKDLAKVAEISNYTVTTPNIQVWSYCIPNQ